MRGIDRLARGSLWLMAAVVLGFAAWQFAMPPGFLSVRGLNPLAVGAWRGAFGLSALGTVAMPVYAVVFQTALALPFVIYAIVLWSVARGGRVDFRATVVGATLMIALLAIAMPASLSTDVFAYVGYARLQVVHGLNPHVATQADLVRLGDPTAPYLHWPIPSPYGPLWTLVSMAVVRVAPAQSVWGVVVVYKALAGAALLGAAAAGRAIIAAGALRPSSTAVEPAGANDDSAWHGQTWATHARRADATFALIAFNPLLLIEGPGCGHNDLLMVAFMVGGVAALSARRPGWAAFLVGVAAAFKVIPLLLVPWLAVLAARAARPRWHRRLAAVGATLFLGTAPLAAAYIPFWEGMRTFSGLTERWGRVEGAATASSEAAVASSPLPQSGSDRAGRDAGRDAGRPVSDEQRNATAVRGGGQGGSSVARFLARGWPVLAVALWGWLAICLGRGEPALRLATVWAFVAFAAIVFGAALWLPWYLAWVWPFAVLSFTRAHVVLCACSLAFSLVLMLAYGVPP